MDLVIKRTHSFKCKHNTYLVDDKLGYVECGICGEHLSPMWVLEQFCNSESRANLRIIELNRIANKAEKKNRCKCEKCGEMTRIQR